MNCLRLVVIFIFEVNFTLSVGFLKRQDTLLFTDSLKRCFVLRLGSPVVDVDPIDAMRDL